MDDRGHKKGDTWKVDRLGTEDGRQGAEPLDRGQRTGDKEQSRETGMEDGRQETEP